MTTDEGFGAWGTDSPKLASVGMGNWEGTILQDSKEANHKSTGCQIQGASAHGRLVGPSDHGSGGQSGGPNEEVVGLVTTLGHLRHIDLSKRCRQGEEVAS